MFRTSEAKKLTVCFEDIKTEEQFMEEAQAIIDTVDHYLSLSGTLYMDGVNIYGKPLSIHIADDEYTNGLDTEAMLLEVMDRTETIVRIPFTRTDTLIFNDVLEHKTNTHMTTLEIKN